MASCSSAATGESSGQLGIAAASGIGDESRIVRLEFPFRMRESQEQSQEWTDDKHSSYLSSMEEMFVRNMFDREYCCLDICGLRTAAAAHRHRDEALPDDDECVESTPSFVKVLDRIEKRGASSSSSSNLSCRTCTACELDEEQAQVPEMKLPKWHRTGADKIKRLKTEDLISICLDQVVPLGQAPKLSLLSDSKMCTTCQQTR